MKTIEGFSLVLVIIVTLGGLLWTMPSIKEPQPPPAGEAIGVSTFTDSLNVRPIENIEECFLPQMVRIDDHNFRMEALNFCHRDLPHVFVLIKFLDEHGNRIGVSQWEAHYVAELEFLTRRMPVPSYVGHYTRIAVRKISDDPSDRGK